jgi:hypothetical protein
MRIIKRGTCPQITPTSKSKLTYDVGYNEQFKTYHIRIIGNSGGGFFSNQWIAVEDCIQAAPTGEPFKALVFKPFYESKGANNHGFLSAALREEGILNPAPKAAYSHLLGDPEAFTKAMAKLVKSKANLEDTVAIREAKIEAKRAAQAEKLKKAAKKKS